MSDLQVGDGSPIYQVSNPAAKKLADLLSTKQDLDLAKQFVEMSIGQATSPVKIAFFMAAHVNYRRAFNRPQGGLWAKDVEALGSEAVEIHDFYYAQADKLVAHSVNAFETVKIGVWLKDERLAGVANIGMRFTGYPDDEYRKWAQLIDSLVSGPLWAKTDKAYYEVADAVRELPVSQIRRGDQLENFWQNPSREAAFKRR